MYVCHVALAAFRPGAAILPGDYRKAVRHKVNEDEQPAHWTPLHYLLTNSDILLCQCELVENILNNTSVKLEDFDSMRGPHVIVFFVKLLVLAKLIHSALIPGSGREEIAIGYVACPTCSRHICIVCWSEFLQLHGSTKYGLHSLSRLCATSFDLLLIRKKRLPVIHTIALRVRQRCRGHSADARKS